MPGACVLHACVPASPCHVQLLKGGHVTKHRSSPLSFLPIPGGRCRASARSSAGRSTLWFTPPPTTTHSPTNPHAHTQAHTHAHTHTHTHTPSHDHLDIAACKTQTLRLNRQIPKPQPKTLNPKPSTLNSKTVNTKTKQLKQKQVANSSAVRRQLYDLEKGICQVYLTQCIHFNN